MPLSVPAFPTSLSFDWYFPRTICDGYVSYFSRGCDKVLNKQCQGGRVGFGSSWGFYISSGWGRQGWGGEATSHIAPTVTKQIMNRKWDWVTKPQSPSPKKHFLHQCSASWSFHSLHEQCHQLGTKCSNTCAWSGQFTFRLWQWILKNVQVGHVWSSRTNNEILFSLNMNKAGS